MKSKRIKVVVAIATAVIAMIVCVTVYLVKFETGHGLKSMYPNPNDIPIGDRTPEIQAKIDRYNELGKSISKLNLSAIQRKTVEKSYMADSSGPYFPSNWVADYFSTASIRCIGNFRGKQVFLFAGEAVMDVITYLPVGSKTFTFGHSISIIIYDKSSSKTDNYNALVNQSGVLSDGEIAECEANLSEFLEYCSIARNLYDLTSNNNKQTSTAVMTQPIYYESDTDTVELVTVE